MFVNYIYISFLVVGYFLEVLIFGSLIKKKNTRLLLLGGSICYGNISGEEATLRMRYTKFTGR